MSDSEPLARVEIGFCALHAREWARIGRETYGARPCCEGPHKVAVFLRNREQEG